MVDVIESLVDLLESLVDLLEPLVNLLEPLLDLLEPHVDLPEALQHQLALSFELFLDAYDPLAELQHRRRKPLVEMSLHVLPDLFEIPLRQRH